MEHISLKDIAARTGVSFQTVSKVLKGKGSVSSETRSQILQVAEQLGYVPNAVARSLVNQRTCTIGVVASDFSDYVLAQFIVGAEHEVRRQGQSIIVGSINQDGTDGERYIRILLEQRVDGILLAAPQLEQNADVGEILRGHVPVVGIHRVPDTVITLVGSDLLEPGLLATRHLLELGHRRIGTIIGPQERSAARGRLRGYQKALKEAGIAYDPDLVENGEWRIEKGHEATNKLLDRVPDLTAIFAQNDMMAVGVLSALHGRGLHVPEDCAVVGCDDILIAAHTIPPLTTIHIPFYETGETAAKLLLDMITQPTETASPQRVLLAVQLVPRASSGVHRTHPTT